MTSSERDSRAPRSGKPSQAPSHRPRTSSLRARPQSMAPAATLSPSIREELWFGGHDNSIAESNAARSMAALVGRIIGAKPFPESARRLADLTRSEVIRIEPVVQVLECDPALSARLLRLVNSAGYALRQRCTSVRHAATLVGTDRLHQIATTAAVLDMFDARGSIATEILAHCTATGAISRYLGAHLSLPVDDLFAAGFLHDIGKMMLLETEGDQYVELLSTHAHQPNVVHVVERSLYGFDHAVLAAHVLSEWNIPDPVPRLVAWHHDAPRSFDGTPIMAALTQTLKLADTVAHALASGATREQLSQLAGSESASYLDISEPQLASMWEDMVALCQNSAEQSQGDVAPALDPRSLRPRHSLSASGSVRSPDLPLQYPCVACGGPTFGNSCRACGGYMCPSHHIGRDDWCALCARDFEVERIESAAAVPLQVIAATCIGTLLITAAMGYESGGLVGSVQASFGTALLLILGLMLWWILRRSLLRSHFLRTRPNRRVSEAFQSDGGVKSIAPPVAADQPAMGGGDKDPLSELIRLAGTNVERVEFNDVPPGPDLIARGCTSVLARPEVAADVTDWNRESNRADQCLQSFANLQDHPSTDDGTAHRDDYAMLQAGENAGPQARMVEALSAVCDSVPGLSTSEDANARTYLVGNESGSDAHRQSALNVASIDHGVARSQEPESSTEVELSTPIASLSGTSSESPAAEAVVVSKPHPLASLGAFSSTFTHRRESPAVAQASSPDSSMLDHAQSRLGFEEQEHSTLVGMPSPDPESAVSPERQAIVTQASELAPSEGGISGSIADGVSCDSKLAIPAPPLRWASAAHAEAPAAPPTRGELSVETEVEAEAALVHSTPGEPSESSFEVRAAGDPPNQLSAPVPAAPSTSARPNSVRAMRDPTAAVVSEGRLEQLVPGPQPVETDAVDAQIREPQTAVAEQIALERERPVTNPEPTHAPLVGSAHRDETLEAATARSLATASDEIESIVNTLDIQRLGEALGLGTEFRRRVMERVAERVAEAISERVVRSLELRDTGAAQPRSNLAPTDEETTASSSPKAPRRREKRRR